MDNPRKRASLPSPNSAQPHVTRRLFLKTSGAAAAGVAVTTPAMAQGGTPEATPVGGASDPSPLTLEFFNPVEAAMVEAAAARIFPGTPDDPGAREAGVLTFIDRHLSGTNEGFTQKTYSHGPFLDVNEDQAEDEVTSRTDIYQVVPVQQADVSRYGFQSVLTPQRLYRRGLASLAAHAEESYGAPFTDLSDEQQDEILTAMEADEVPGFDAPSGSAFFSMLRNDTIEGVFSDPMYGGNRDMVGWRLIGFPGVRGFYTAAEMEDPEFSVEPVSLADMTGGHSH
jgi:gluconate 2-dehydrogenase gamma chain